jgi:hypothetical protein
VPFWLIQIERYRIVWTGAAVPEAQVPLALGAVTHTETTR